MAESTRSTKKSSDPASHGRGGQSRESERSRRSGPDWAGQSAGNALGLQRKAQVNEPGDAYEKEAESAADRVSGGGHFPAQKMSSVTPGSVGGGEQRAAKPESGGHDEKKEGHHEAVQKASKAEDKKPDDKTKAVQKASKPEDKKPDDETKAVQKASKPEDKKPDDKTKAVQKASKPEDKKKDDKTKAVQKAHDPGEHDKKAVQTALKKDTMPPEKTMPPKSAAQHREADAAGSAGKGGKEQAGPKKNEPQKKEEAPPAAPAVQKAPSAGSGSSSPSTAASNAIAGKGQGKPLTPNTRGTLERGYGVDLAHVRVHDDPKAQQSAADLNARAFTHQNDIWLGRGESQSETRLMAHEVAHVIQQSDSVQRSTIQRAFVQRAKGDKPAATGKDAAAGKSVENPAGSGVFDAPGIAKVDTKAKKILIPELSLPSQANKATGSAANPIPTASFTLKAPTPRTDQREKWKTQIAGGGIGTEADKMLTEANKVPGAGGAAGAWYVKLAAENSFMVGDNSGLKERFKLPNWFKDGKHKSMDVDHVTELQLGGSDGIANYQLLESRANFSSGSRIDKELKKKIQGTIDANNDSGKPFADTPSTDTVRKNWEITFEKVTPSAEGLAGSPEILWSVADVQAGQHLKHVQAIDDKHIDQYNVREDATKLRIFLGTGATAAKTVPYEASGNVSAPGALSVPGFGITKVDYKPGAGGTLTGQLWKNSKFVAGSPEIPLTLTSVEGLQYTANLESRNSITRKVAAAAKGMKAKGSSPIEILDADLGPTGILVTGVIRPDFSLLKGQEIDFRVEGEDFTLSKTFPAGALSLPGPIKVTGGSLTISAGTRGLEIDANVTFAIERVGHGSIGAKAAMAQGFEVTGSFDFDTDMFDPAKVEIKYKRPPEGEGEWSGSGKLGIKEGKITGIKSADITASYEKGELAAKGNVKLSAPGIQEGTMEAKFSEKDGISIGGKFTLGDIPGISGGSVEAKVEQKEGRWAVTAKGSATPKIPGISATLEAAYEDGAITIEGHAAYEKGMLKGEITVGATNRPVDAEGKPGGAPTPTMRAYGGGSVTVQIAPWLKGTVGVRLLPNGEIEVSGTIALPSSLDIFPEKSIHKNIFSINIDIPILGVAVAGQRIGIFATIGGGLDAEAGIGPGQLRDTSLSVTYNPAHEEDTHVSGNARLYIPAHAGLRLFVRGGIGVGIPIVSATAGLEIGAQLGLEGAIDTSLHVDWSPKTGLELTAQGEIFVEPKFKFDVTGFVMVTADLILTTIELYNKRFTLASFEYGSNLRFGVRFPIHYKEGQPFDISLSDVEFITPQVDAGDILSGLVKKAI